MYRALNRALLRRDVSVARLGAGPDVDRHTDPVELPAGFEIATLDTSSVVGQTLEDLDLPRRLGVTVLAVDTWSEAEERLVRHAPCAADRLGAKDRLVVIGPSEQLAELRSTQLR